MTTLPVFSKPVLPEGKKPQAGLLSDLLTNFRQQLETEAGVSSYKINTTAATLLYDLCAYLGFKPRLIARVVGEKNTRMLGVEDGKRYGLEFIKH